MGFSIAILAGVQAGDATGKSGDRVLVGSASDCDLILPDQGVSVRHCLVGVKQQQVWVRDLGSEGGTKVNGKPLAAGVTYRLNDSDVVGVGPHVKLQFKRQQETSDKEASSAIVRWLDDGNPLPSPPPDQSVPSPAIDRIPPKPRKAPAPVADRRLGGKSPGGSKARVELVMAISEAITRFRAGDLASDEEVCSALDVVWHQFNRRLQAKKY